MAELSAVVLTTKRVLPCHSRHVLAHAIMTWRYKTLPNDHLPPIPHSKGVGGHSVSISLDIPVLNGSWPYRVISRGSTGALHPTETQLASDA